MARYVSSVEIARAPRVVWDFLDTPENAPRYVEGAIRMELVSGARKGVGTRVLRVHAVGAAPMYATEDVLAYEDGVYSRRLGRVGWFATFDGSIRIDALEGSRSRVTFDYAYSPTVAAVLAVVFWPFFLIAMRGRIDRMAQAAKRVLESEEAGAYRSAG